MQRRLARAGVGLGMAALLPTLQACYDYAPLATPTAPTGELVELQITDQGRVGLADRFGPGLNQIRGRILSQQGNELVVAVNGVTHITGNDTQWSGESVNLDRQFIGSIKARKISVVRTALIAVAVGAVVYFTAGRGLAGSFSGLRDEPEPGGPPATKIRIPVTP